MKASRTAPVASWCLGSFMTTTGSTLMGGDALGGTVSYLEARTWDQRYCLAVDKLKHLE